MAKVELLQSYIHANQNLINEIAQCRVSKDDVLLTEYVIDAGQKLRDNRNYIDQLKAQNKELTQILTSVSSPQVEAVKKVIQSLRDSATWYTCRKNSKADVILEALCKTPLLERGLVITESGPVQDALALHRFSGRVYKNPEGEIDREQAPSTCRHLISFFAPKESRKKDEDISQAKTSTII